MSGTMTGLNGHSGMNGTPHGESADIVWAANGSPDNGSPDNGSAEHERLEMEIAAAKARTAAARERAAALDAEVQADMRQELVASRQTVDEMERNHAAAIAMIRDGAQAEADRILVEARQQAVAARGVRHGG